ncbi:hypothetical protein BGX30_009310 [Mortierella sp. GBA39]|nr:hypothetical protein BGX30_009310 [Mortierella sp. GBA39]
MINLLTPMLHNGMIVVGLPGNIPENALYGSYYGVGVTCPVELSDDDPKNLPGENDLALGRALGKRVAELAGRFSSAARPQAAEQQGDRAYRDALRQFAGGTPAKEEEPPAPKPDYSTDNAYREALRSMAKNKK